MGIIIIVVTGARVQSFPRYEKRAKPAAVTCAPYEPYYPRGP